MEINKNEKAFRDLITKYVQGKTTEEENKFLDLYFESFENRPDILESISDEEQNLLLEKLKNNIFDKITESEKPKGILRRINTKVWLRAAVLTGIILLSAFLYYNFNQGREPKNAVAVTEDTLLNNDILPGGNKAVLTLADGKQVILDETDNGLLAMQGDVSVIKSNDGELSYEKSGTGAKSVVTYNTVSTPRGGMYQLTLSDGTKVWLNAESSLRYPTSFTGKDRKVELTGEGYFEVAHNASKPFFVNTGSMNVQVLGTRFNINTYADDGNLKTTLFEGSVEVNAGSSKVRLKPGEQARLQLSDNVLQSSGSIDLDQVLAWKEGYFSFQDAGLKDIMMQISRWYDVDVIYQGNILPRKFGGSIARKSELSSVLKILEAGNVHFKLEGRNLIVMP